MNPIIKISKIGDVDIEPKCNLWEYDHTVCLCWYRISSATMRLKVGGWASEVRDEIIFDDGTGLNFIHDIYKKDAHLNNELSVTLDGDLKFFNFIPEREEENYILHTSIHRYISKMANVE